MRAKRLGIPKAAFHHMQNNEPEILSELGATCFEHEVARLMDRYKTPDAEALLKAQKQRQVTPDEYMHAFKVGFGIQCERFASPLDFNPEVQQYYSLHEIGFLGQTPMHTAPNGRGHLKPTQNGPQRQSTKP
ncbi:hypothetical protein ABBQ32_010033 [Trebouxia sp. C0010 RCD-2024]